MKGEASIPTDDLVPLYIAAHNRPKENDAYSGDEFRKPLEMVSQQKGDTSVLGDLNYPKLDWDKNDVPFIKPGCAHHTLYDSFIETMLRVQSHPDGT